MKIISQKFSQLTFEKSLNIYKKMPFPPPYDPKSQKTLKTDSLKSKLSAYEVNN